MKKLMHGLMENDLFVMLVSGVFAHMAMMAVIISVLQVPSEAILDSGLDQVLLVFEDIPE
jgi:hypothetical protein